MTCSRARAGVPSCPKKSDRFRAHPAGRECHLLDKGTDMDEGCLQDKYNVLTRYGLTE